MTIHSLDDITNFSSRYTGLIEFEKEFSSLDESKLAISNYIDYYNSKQIKTKLKHTKISSEEISDGRKYSLLFLYVKVVVSC